MSISQDSLPRSGASLAASVVAAGIAVADDKFTITGSSDATKTIKFEADAQSAGADLTIDAGAQTADRTLTLPALAGAANLVVREAALTDNAVIRADSTLGKIQDSVVIIGDTGAVSGVTTLSMGTVLTLLDTSASSSSGGPATIVRVNDGAAMASGDRLGLYTFSGARDGSGTFSTTASMECFASEAWGAGAAGSELRFGTTANGGTTRATKMTLGNNGVLTIPAGIIFSNETLSTYDEGTFSPTIFGSGTAGTPTYDVQIGRYIRVGNKVSCEIYVSITAKTGIAGNVRIGGLPFTVKNTGNYYVASTVGEYGGITFAAGRTQLTPAAALNSTYIGLACCGSIVAVSNITDADIAAATYVILAITYEI